MRILLDENIPIAFLAALVDFDVAHVIKQGWAGIKNGALMLKASEANFDVLITFDSGIAHQHAQLPVAVVILKPYRQGLRPTLALLPRILESLPNLERGKSYVIQGGYEESL